MLTVVGLDRVEDRRTFWNCACDCGTIRSFRSDHARKANASCGCVKTGQRASAERNCPVGQRYGRLVVIAFEGYKTSPSEERARLFWRCRCDCGTESSIEAVHIKAGRTTSCGCLTVDLLRQRNTGRPSNARKEFGKSSQNVLMVLHRGRAKRLGREFALTKEQFNQIVSSNCHYCGAKPSNRIQSKNCYGFFEYNGIDRKDNAIGYTIGNSVPCCWYCNRAKGGMSAGDFIVLCRRVISHIDGAIQ